MWCFYILIFVAVVQGKSITNEELKGVTMAWPDSFSCKAIKIDLVSSIVYHFSVWQTPDMVRLDENDVSTLLTKDTNGSKIIYETFPVMNKEERTHFKCKKLDNTTNVEVILPSLQDSNSLIGTEELNNVTCYVYYSNHKVYDERNELKVWAAKSNGNMMKPVRYEHKTYDTWLGRLSSYYIWEYHDFINKVDSKYFDEYNIDSCEVEDGLDKTEVPEDLLFLNPEDDDNIEQAFSKFKKEHNKAYFGDEHDMRKEIFRKNLRLISEVNRQNLGYKLAVNNFADLTEAEMEKYKGLRPRPEGDAGNIPFPYSETELMTMAESLPKEYDARLHNLVTPVRHQSQCGACWSFGCVAGVEGALARSTGKLISLSEQALVDCSWAYSDNGCGGGNQNSAYNWIMKYGLPTTAEYGSYTATEGFCNIKNMTKTYTIRGYTNVTSHSINALKVALVNHGPIVVGFQATNYLSLYSSGILYDLACQGDKYLNHMVTVVGYGEKHGETYWIVKNSWGKNWGLDGYFHIAAKNELCGITAEPAYVVM